MTVLVTGASGFVGSAITRRLVEAGRRVRAMVRRGSDRRNLEGLDVDVVVGDLTDPASLKRALRGCDGLFHAAADHRAWVSDPKPMFAVNVHGTRDLMLAALGAGVERIVFTSDAATRGLRGEGPGDAPKPVRFEDMSGPYWQSKFLAEEAVRRLIADRGLPCVIVAPTTAVGPRDAGPSPMGRLVLRAAARRLPVYVDRTLDLVHVGDVADGHVRAYERGRVGKPYVLGGDAVTFSRVLAEIADICGHRPPGVRLAPGLAEPLARLSEGWCRRFGGLPVVTLDEVRTARRPMHVASARARRDLSYSSRPSRVALADAIAWFRSRRMLA